MVQIAERDTYLLQHTPLHPHLQTLLLHYATGHQKYQLAYIPNLTPKNQNKILKQETNKQNKKLPPYGAQHLTENPNTTPQNLQQIWDNINNITTDPAWKQTLQANIIKHPNCPNNILEQTPELITHHQNQLIQIALTERPNIPTTLKNQLEKPNMNKTPQLDLYLTLQTPYTPTQLTQLLTNPTTPTNQHNNLLQHPNCPPELLNQLAQTAQNQEHITKNPSCPAQLLEKINQQLKKQTKTTNQPWNYQNVHLNEQQGKLLANIANHPNCPANLAEELALSEIHTNMISSHAQKNPALTTNQIKNLLENHPDAVNYAIYQNPNTTAEILAEEINKNLASIYDLNFIINPLLKKLPRIPNDELQQTLPALTKLPAPYHNAATLTINYLNNTEAQKYLSITTAADPEIQTITLTNIALHTQNPNLQLATLQKLIQNQTKENTTPQFTQAATQLLISHLTKNPNLTTAQKLTLQKLTKENPQHNNNHTQTTPTIKPQPVTTIKTHPTVATKQNIQININPTK